MTTIHDIVADAYATPGGAARLARDLGVDQSTLTRLLAGAVPRLDLLARVSRLRPDLDLAATAALASGGAVMQARGAGVRIVWPDGTEATIRPRGRRVTVDGERWPTLWGVAYRAACEASGRAAWEGVCRG